MLSRVANRVYWLGRYMERAENTARIINVNSNLLRGSRVNWHTLIEIVGSDADFQACHHNKDESAVIKFMIADHNNFASILNSVRCARENARTTREILPSEAWECVNELYLHIKESAVLSLGRKERYYFLQKVIQSSQQLTGMLMGTMSHNHAYEFLQLGNNIERADMSSRLIDLGVSMNVPNLLDNPDDYTTADPYQSILWMNILTSLSAHQSYRQQVQNRINGEKVVKFLLIDHEFPRSIMYCMYALSNALNNLPSAEMTRNSVEKIISKIENFTIDLSGSEKLHRFIDDLQINFAELNQEIEDQWFLA